ncbi:MAG: hypothetical protein M1829_003844 [Trizodia sp. TS-e1964]|nr:MAG: hypothetical protein M1829_003844 [Trizodia sp. TS-e1964]
MRFLAFLSLFAIGLGSTLAAPTLQSSANPETFKEVLSAGFKLARQSIQNDYLLEGIAPSTNTQPNPNLVL